MKILVIEDNTKHIADAMNYAKKLNGCGMDFADNLTAAMELLENNSYDGAICDVFFPKMAGDSADSCENAIIISSKLTELGIHHVFNTAGNHHGRKFEKFIWKTPIAIHAENPDDHSAKYHFLASGMVIEAYPQDSDSEKDSKQWQAAFRYILLVNALLQLPEKGESIIKAAALSGFPYGEYGELTKRFQECTNAFVLETFQKYNA